MSKNRNNHRSSSPDLSRRRFLNTVAGVTAAAGFPSLFSPGVAQAAAPGFGDYKALVCIMLAGGNDGYNMLVPHSASSYNQYASARGSLSVSDSVLTHSGVATGNLGTGAANPYHSGSDDREAAYLKGYYNVGLDVGVNGLMPELAQLISDQQVSVIGNCGTLVRPGITRNAILNNSADLPLFLFAHNHQVRALQTGQADNLKDIGWAGRIADAWSGINGGSPLGLNISYKGNNRMLIGNHTTPLILRGAPPRYERMVRDDSRNKFRDASNDRRALFRALLGQSGQSTARVSFGADKTFVGSDPFISMFNNSLGQSMEVSEMLYDTWFATDPTYTSTDPYGNPLFTIPAMADLGFDAGLNGGLIEQLQHVAKMIHLSQSGAFPTTFNRQIFFVQLGGFDTHGGQKGKHALLLRELSLALWSFQKAMDDLGLSNNVMSFTMSDFGRSLRNNGDGTDHAWASHHLVMGGDGTLSSGNLDGGKMLGRLPEFVIEGVDDASSKGRMIPDIGQDQINASLCQWFGVDQASMPLIFPNIENFKTGSNLDSAYLDLIV
jgi:uncharacterized protein (DUF1501 family)